MGCDNEMLTRFSSDTARSVLTAEISREVEEFLVSGESEVLCRRLLAGGITFEQYFAIILSRSWGGCLTRTQE